MIDAGNPGVWSYLWEIPRPNTYIKPVGFGNMGFALPAAIGTKVARPEVPVIAFIGDGSLGMSLAELETVAREDLPICIVVMNDSGYGNIRHRVGDGTLGWPEEAPFDAILVSAGGPSVPAALTAQLAPGGRLVIPVGGRGHQTLVRVTRTGPVTFEQEDLGGVMFVPLVGEQGWR